jgi:hypothetical protein
LNLANAHSFRAVAQERPNLLRTSGSWPSVWQPRKAEESP